MHEKSGVPLANDQKIAWKGKQRQHTSLALHDSGKSSQLKQETLSWKTRLKKRTNIALQPLLYEKTRYLYRRHFQIHGPEQDRRWQKYQKNLPRLPDSRSPTNRWIPCRKTFDRRSGVQQRIAGFRSIRIAFPKRHNYPVSIGKITYTHIIDPHVTRNIKIEAKLGRNRWFCEVEMQNCLGANFHYPQKMRDEMSQQR